MFRIQNRIAISILVLSYIALINGKLFELPLIITQIFKIEIPLSGSIGKNDFQRSLETVIVSFVIVKQKPENEVLIRIENP